MQGPELSQWRSLKNSPWFDKKLVLTSLILHEIVLFLWFALMVVATIFSKDMPQIMVHPIILLALLGIGGGISKTAKAIKAEDGK